MNQQDSAEQLFIGIDSGGTHTRGLLADAQGSTLKRYHGAGANPKDIGWEAAHHIFKDCITQLLKDQQGVLKKVCITAAGIGYPDAHSPQQWAAPIGIEAHKLIIIGDAFAAHLGAFDNADGIMVVAGTGTALVARKGKQLKRLGGWGHILGDQGSGYAIGLTGLRQAVLDSDLAISSKLKEAMEEVYKVNHTQALLEIIHSSAKATVAKFAKAVLVLAAEGDECCQSLIKEQLETFPLLFQRFQSLGFPAVVSYTGGLFEHPYYLDAFSRSVKKSGFSLHPPSSSALDATIQIALGKLEPIYASL